MSDPEPPEDWFVRLPDLGSRRSTLNSKFPLDLATEIEGTDVLDGLMTQRLTRDDLLDWLSSEAEHYWNKGFEAGRTSILEEIHDDPGTRLDKELNRE